MLHYLELFTGKCIAFVGSFVKHFAIANAKYFSFLNLLIDKSSY